MRNRIIFAALGVSLLLCIGCGQRSEGESEQLSGSGVAVAGSVDCPKTDGLYNGEGSFTAEAGWVYTGSFTDSSFGQGTVDAMPCTVSFCGASFSGLYSGEVSGLLPHGQGTLTADDGGSFAGSFTDGAPTDGQADRVDCTVSFQSAAVTGAYTGPVTGGAPSGQGTFSATGARTLHYEGGFAAGAPSGEGALSDDGYRIRTDGGEERGSFEGSVSDGLPNAQGSFRGRNAENVDYTYTGEWKDGAWNGQGELVYDSALYYVRRGSFTDGRFTPTGMELLEALGSAGSTFTLSDKTKEFIETYPELLELGGAVPGYMECPYRLQCNPYLTHPAYLTDPDKYRSDFMCLYNNRIQRYWEEDSFGEEYRVSCMVATNSLFAEPVICYVFGNVETLATAKSFSSYAIPLGLTSYVNSNGDEIQAIALLVGGITTVG